MLTALPARPAPRLPNLQDLPFVALVVGIVQTVRFFFRIAPEIPHLVQEGIDAVQRQAAAAPERETTFREVIGKSFQEEFYLTVDRIVQYTDQSLHLLLKYFRFAPRMIKIHVWKMTRPIIDRLCPLFSSLFPPSTMEPPPLTPTMNVASEKQIRQALLSATWIRRRNVVVNVESNTISVFDEVDEHDSDLEEVPLSLHEVPIIPHPFPRPTPLLTAPDGFDPQGPLHDGLSNQELLALRDYFLGMLQSIEFYFDRIIVLTVETDFFKICTDKVGGDCFRAFGCVVLLVAAGESMKRGRGKSPPKEHVSPGGVRPGGKVYNGESGYSTVGAFLVEGKDYPTTEYLLSWFTVSAHSFLRKRSLKLGLTWSTIIVIPIIARIAFRFALSSFFGISFCRQYLLARLFIWSWEMLWKYWGRKVGWHHLVCAMSSVLTSQQGSIRVEKPLAPIQVTLLYVIPVLLRAIITFSLALSNRALYFFISVPRVIETAIMVLYMPILKLCVEGKEDEDNNVEVEPSSMVRSWLRVKFVTDFPIIMV